MSTNRSLALAVIGVLAVSAAVTWLVICPNYREVTSLKTKIRELDVRIESLSSERVAVQNLATDVAQARERSQSQLKIIPDVPDVADLIRKLSLPVDGVNVVDQTFTAGEPNDLELGHGGSVKSMPLTVGMAATFDSVFALMRAAESMNRLLRVSSVKVAIKRDPKEDATPAPGIGSSSVPVLEASLGIEAMYAPVIAQAESEAP